MSSSARPAAPALATPTVKLSRVEWAIVILALLALGTLRWFTVYSHRWNTDEPQHLHVVWAWTVGKLQYRDIFDNHTPLFHILNAPLLRWLGERADIVLPMRRAMIPLFAISVWCVYRLGSLIYDRRTGWFAALLAAFLPAFFFRMGEFRTDVMWTTLWLVTLAVALSGRLTPWRTFGAALLLGAAFSVSMKTTLLVFCGAVAGLLTWLLAGRPVSKAWPQHLLAFVAGLLIVPGAIVGYYASQGALEPLYYCVIKHNTLPGQHLGQMIAKQVLAQSTLWLIPTILCTRLMLPAVRREPAQGYRRLFLFLFAGTFYSLLRGFWPVVTTQDYMPWLPLLPIFAVAGLAWGREQWTARFGKALPWVLAPLLVLVGEMIWILKVEAIFTRNEDKQIAGLASLLHLADPGEYVLDLKGETIFRPRPTYLVFESLTREQLKNGRLKEDTIPRLIATRTAVVHYSDRLTAETKDFIGKNYVHVQNARVLGQKWPTVQDQPFHFEIVIPERYMLVGSKGPISGMLDGKPIDGPRFLDAGPHELTVTNHIGDVATVWARAWERGFSPFVTYDPPAIQE